MKLSNTYSIGALATIFSSTQALTGNSLIALADGQTTGIIWNSDKSLCLKLSGKVFEDALSGSPANPGKKRRPKKENTCAGVSASFSSDCADRMEEGTLEDNLPLEYRFRIAEHADRGDRFCIISACDDGLNESGSVYKLQWKGSKKGNKGRFQLKTFGGDSPNVLDEYFQFDESNSFTYGSMSQGSNNPVIWKEVNGNKWQVKDSNKVDQYNLVPVSEACESENTESENTESAYDLLNDTPTEYTMCGEIGDDDQWDDKSKYLRDYVYTDDASLGHEDWLAPHLNSNEIFVTDFPATIKTPGYPNDFLDLIDENLESQVSCHTKVRYHNLPEGWVYRVQIEDIDIHDNAFANRNGLLSTDNNNDGGKCVTNALLLATKQMCEFRHYPSGVNLEAPGNLEVQPKTGTFYISSEDVDKDIDIISVIHENLYWANNDVKNDNIDNGFKVKMIIDVIPTADMDPALEVVTNE